MTSTRCLLPLLALSLLPLTSASAQAPSSHLRHIEGTDAETGTEYTRILLRGQLLSSSPLAPIAYTEGKPTLIAQCTRQPSGKLAFDLFTTFGEASDFDFHAPVPSSPSHPRPAKVEVTLDFSGYTHINGLKRQWESLREPSGMLRYSSPGFRSSNLEDTPILLRYLVALPELRLTIADHSAAFDTRPLLTDIRSEPLCKAALL